MPEPVDFGGKQGAAVQKSVSDERLDCVQPEEAAVAAHDQRDLKPDSTCRPSRDAAGFGVEDGKHDGDSRYLPRTSFGTDGASSLGIRAFTFECVEDGSCQRLRSVLRRLLHPSGESIRSGGERQGDLRAHPKLDSLSLARIVRSACRRTLDEGRQFPA